MRNIWTIVKKELTRVFTDKGVIISLFILPPLTIYLIYGLMGMSAEKANKSANEYTAIVYVINAPDKISSNEKEAASFEAFLDENLEINANITYEDSNKLVEIKTKLENEEIDLIIEFPSNFKETVENYIDTLPKVNMYYNINKTYAENIYLSFQNTLTLYENKIAGTRVDLDLLKVFEIVKDKTGDDEKEKGSAISKILPLLIVIYLMAGGMGIGMESVAGEKERGTIATLLVTPIKRSQLAIGKIISISIISVLSSIASFIGLLAVMPSFAKIGGDTEEGFGKISYDLTDYAMLFTVMFAAVLLFVAIIVVVSTYSKSVKQAGTLVMPIYLLVMGAAFFNVFTQDIPQSISSYIIPIYNIVLALKAVFQFELSITNWLFTVASTFGYTIILIFLIQKMFRSEKIMFNK